MKIQSLSIAVPAKCPNKCSFCVAHMHREDYINQIEKNKKFRHLYKNDYIKRMAYARDNGCNVLMFTGNGEPMMNENFMEDVSSWNQLLDRPFRQIELQTCGWGINEGSLRWLRNEVGVTTISLSLSSFNNEINALYNGSKNWKLNIEAVSLLIKKYDFNLRYSLNMTKDFNNLWPRQIFGLLKATDVNQVIFRKLYSDRESDASRWVKENKASQIKLDEIKDYIVSNGNPIRKLSYGTIVYDVGGISTIIDTDCMNQELTEDIKYLILREDCKLYSHWESKGSLIF
jgi:wyosine [tRNA(Phe)-imidazoG37] synthetase (radical SAM superfamily)